jgi:hypothetical protein
MKKRAYISFDDDAQVAKIDSLAAKFRTSGMEVTSIARTTGNIFGVIDEKDVGKVRRQAAQSGGKLTLEDEDARHELPPPSAEIQGFERLDS